jgi:membrane fusion protein (multidrug efflux system)
MFRILRLVAVLPLLAAMAFQVGCGSDSQSKTPGEDETETAVPVEVAEVEVGDIAAFFSGTASLEAEQEAVVVAKVGGVVKEILVEEGTVVRAGQVLARLDDERLAVRVAQAEANLRKLENDFRRNKELFAKNLVSAEIFQRVKFEYESQKAAFDLARLELEYAAIRAPISGVVAERLIKVGNMVLANAATFRISDFDPLLAVLYVPEKEMSKLRVGQPAKLSVDAVPGVEFSGRIERISPVVDPQTGTFKVTVEVRDPSRRLKPGMFARVNIIYDVHENTLLVPKEAILAEDTESAVFVVRDNVAYRKVVETGYSDATRIEVSAGLAPGDTIVITGQATLKDSSKVELVGP